MTKEGEIYACKICGNVVKVIASGSGILVCCGKPMELVEE
jgi:superoxide reductase